MTRVAKCWGIYPGKGLARKYSEPIGRRMTGQGLVRVQKQSVDGIENMEDTGVYVKEIGRVSV